MHSRERERHDEGRSLPQREQAAEEPDNLTKNSHYNSNFRLFCCWLYAIIIGQAKKGDDTMKNIELSACEEMIMTIIWNNEAELDLAAVMTQTNERYHTAWKPQTVSTFLARAKKKGFLASYQKGRYSYYQPLVSKEEYRKMKLLALLTKFYDNDKEAMKKDIMA